MCGRPAGGGTTVVELVVVVSSTLVVLVVEDVVVVLSVVVVSTLVVVVVAVVVVGTDLVVVVVVVVGGWVVVVVEVVVVGGGQLTMKRVELLVELYLLSPPYVALADVGPLGSPLKVALTVPPTSLRGPWDPPPATMKVTAPVGEKSVGAVGGRVTLAEMVQEAQSPD